MKSMNDPNRTKEESHTLQKKARRSPASSLASRVLFISFIFVILPLILYSFLVYSKEYHRKLNSVFDEMKLFQEDQLTIIKDMQDDSVNFILTFVALMEAIKHESSKLSDFELEPILLEYAKRSEITSIFLVEQKKTGELICTKSTLPLYKDVDFSKYFPKEILSDQKVQIFVAKDPVFGHSLYITQRIPDTLDDVVAMTVTSFSLENVIEQLQERRTIFAMEISILDEELNVLSSSDPDLLKLKLQPFKAGQEVQKSDLASNVIALEQTRTVENGFKYYFMGKKRFCVIAKLPNTNTYLFTSVPSGVLLDKMIESIYNLMILLACVLIIGGVAAFFFTKRISRPLRKLGNVMSAVGQGHLQERYQYDRMGFEINFLGEKFNLMVNSLISYIEEVKKERAVKEAYAKELQIGHEIQQSILPHKDAAFPGVDIAVYFNPAKEVAGDFFDWLIKDHELLVTIADGVGKGISGALYAYDLRSILRSFATTQEKLKDMVFQTNQLFCHDTKETGNFVTAFLAYYDSKNHKLEYVNCGHNYPYIKRVGGELIRLESKGIAFGVQDSMEIDVQSVDLFPGDFLIMYTDGITDAQNMNEELYTESRLREVIETSQHKIPEILVKDIIGGVEVFTSGAEQYDDMTLIVMRVKDLGD